MQGTGRGTNVLILFAATLFWVLAGIMLYRDARRTWKQEIPEPEAKTIAAKALAQVDDESRKAGWFPSQRDPIFNFENDAQGWSLENDASKKSDSDVHGHVSSRRESVATHIV